MYYDIACLLHMYPDRWCSRSTKGIIVPSRDKLGADAAVERLVSKTEMILSGAAVHDDVADGPDAAGRARKPGSMLANSDRPTSSDLGTE